MEPAVALRPDHWFDPSAVVSCSEPHTTETVAAWRLREPTVNEAMGYGGLCENRATAYVDFRRGEYPAALAVALYLPSQAQVRQGQSWTRCDVLLAADTMGTEAAVRTGSLAGAMGQDPAAFWQCTDRLPGRGEVLPLISCTNTHGYELGMIGMTLTSVDGYPSEQVLADEGRTQCDRDLADRAHADPLRHYPVWDPQERMLAGTQLSGGCWLGRKDGEPLAPMR
jgi:hypothetical protein